MKREARKEFGLDLKVVPMFLNLMPPYHQRHVQREKAEKESDYSYSQDRRSWFWKTHRKRYARRDLCGA